MHEISLLKTVHFTWLKCLLIGYIGLTVRFKHHMLYWLFSLVLYVNIPGGTFTILIPTTSIKVKWYYVVILRGDLNFLGCFQYVWCNYNVLQSSYRISIKRDYFLIVSLYSYIITDNLTVILRGAFASVIYLSKKFKAKVHLGRIMQPNGSL